jgi:hypothetical protein
MVSKRKPAILVAILLIAPLLVTPAAAFYFEFQGFVTDKLVYEVGETINMAADLIADFGTGGWCYVSFAVTANEGPLHFDEYNITPSPTIRTFNSSGTILPGEITPGETGVQAFAHFFAEIVDTVQQSDGDTIELTIVRGHLSLTPLVNLTIPVGSNTTIPIRLASIHDSSIVDAGTNATVLITDSTSSVVLNATIITDTQGLLHIEWNDSMGPIGMYNLSIWGSGSDDFLPFAESFPLEVIPAESNLVVIDAPSSAYCQSPNMVHYETVDITVFHEDVISNPITDSSVTWITDYGDGQMAELGNGYYSGVVPIHSDPGQLTINVSAANPSYQDILKSIQVQVVPNPVQVDIQDESWNVTQGDNLNLNLTVNEYLDWGQPISVEFQDSLGQIFFQANCLPDISSATIWSAQENITPGWHTMFVVLPDNHYNLSVNCTFDIVVIGTWSISLSEINGTYGNTLSFDITTSDAMNSTVGLLSYDVYWEDNPTPIGESPGDLVNSTARQYLPLPLSINPGNHTFTFVFFSPYFERFELVLEIPIWMETNISIVIIESDTSSFAVNHTHNLIWGNHKSPTYLVDWGYLCVSSCGSSDFPDHLSKIEFGY